MGLINAKILALEDFGSRPITPEYALLSYSWTSEDEKGRVSGFYWF
jgi:hypothetical protein